MADIENVWLKAYIPETNLSEVKWGQEVIVTTDLQPVSLHGETAVGPELALGTKAMRCLQQCHQQSRANRTDRGNLTK